jgi:hypothetical protein
MLAHLLAIAVGVGSVALYLAAFFFPEVHRKHDFFWSGVGCFYALVLWVDASQISATELLSHTAAIALVARFGWQTLTLRRKRTPRDLQTPLTDQSWQTFGREITSLGATWLRRTPLGRLLPQPGTQPSSPSPSLGGFRASSLKQVDYEFVDDLPSHHGEGAKESSEQASDQSQLQAPPAPSEQIIQPGPSPSSKPHSKSTTTPQLQKSGSAQKLSVRAPQKPGTLVEKGIVLKDWLVEVVTAATKPKPKKPVIVIPPRNTQLETPVEPETPLKAEDPAEPEPLTEKSAEPSSSPDSSSEAADPNESNPQG